MNFETRDRNIFVNGAPLSSYPVWFILEFAHDQANEVRRLQHVIFKTISDNQIDILARDLKMPGRIKLMKAGLTWMLRKPERRRLKITFSWGLLGGVGMALLVDGVAGIMFNGG